MIDEIATIVARLVAGTPLSKTEMQLLLAYYGDGS